MNLVGRRKGILTDVGDDHLSAGVLTTPSELVEIGQEWDQLAILGGSPFYTAEWFVALWDAFGERNVACLVIRDASTRVLRAGVCYRRDSNGRVTGAANRHSDDWDGVAADDTFRYRLWVEVASLGGHSVVLPMMRNPVSVATARRALGSAGYSVVETPTVLSPFILLPDSWDELLRSMSHKLRKQFHQQRRKLDGEGHVTVRTTTGGTGLDRDLHALFRVEASGWKSRTRSAILSDPRRTRLYAEFAHGLARKGWLRMRILELDGRVIAANLGCAFAGGQFVIKSGFDERFAQYSPGLLLRGESLRASLEEGAAFYDFLGGPAAYKTRWGAQLRAKTTVRAFKGWRRPLAMYHARLRPPLRALAREMRRSNASRTSRD